METIFLFIIILSGLVLAHEGGHFLAAKRAGVRVEEFGLGFPPRVWGIRRGETLYSVNLLPLGGFVRVAGEDGIPHAANAPDTHRLFATQPFHVKVWILLAGVAINWFIAALFFGGMQVAGTSIAVDDSDALEGAVVAILGVAQNSPAANAGIALGDRIVAFQAPDGISLSPTKLSDVQAFIQTHAGKELQVTLLRNGEERSVSLVPRLEPPEGQGPLGVSLQRITNVSYPWYEALWRGFFVSVSLSIAMLQGLGDVVHDAFVEHSVPDDLSGPVGIAALTGDAASLGFAALIHFIAILSLNLALLNAFPFPALDGGRIAVAAVEAVIRRPLPARGMAWFHMAGFLLLIFLLLAVTVQDVQKLL